jgi:hypothetical protein
VFMDLQSCSCTLAYPFLSRHCRMAAPTASKMPGPTASKMPAVVSTSAVCSSTAVFELPPDISEDDENLLTTILSALYAGELCSSYKVLQLSNGFLIRGNLLNEDTFEIDHEDLQFITLANPIRIEKVALCRSGGKIELVIKVLNSSQRVMVTTVCSFTATKKRKYSSACG